MPRLPTSGGGGNVQLTPWSSEWIEARSRIIAWAEMQSMHDEDLRSFKMVSVQIG
jgi:hypothetical protein